MSANYIMPAGQVGRSVPRLEGRQKVTGRASYTHNLALPGMLHAKVFRSTIPHGRILSIDTSAAAAVKGVYQVVTGEDLRAIVADVMRQPEDVVERMKEVTRPQL